MTTPMLFPPITMTSEAPPKRVEWEEGGVAPSTALSLLQLMTWLSPAFPIGAFAHSHGLETAIAEGRIVGGTSLLDWLELLLVDGSGWNDLVLFAEAHRAACGNDAARLASVAELTVAMAGSKERRAETLALGTAFERAAAPWRGTGEAPTGDVPYPVAVARLAALHGLPAGDALVAFAHGFASNLVSVATRLVPLGQSEAVSVLQRLEATILAAAKRAEASDLEALGSAAILSDISAMRHEAQATRLFRS